MTRWNTHKNSIRMIIAAIVLMTLTGTALVHAQSNAQQYEGRYIGSTILLQGQVTDTDGNPIAGAVVEIWQTDINGNYNHPNDTDPSALLDDFQYFGTATTDTNGYYAFLTLKAAPYEVRPAHIHFKVKIDGQEVLTSQFYFEEDRADVATDGAYNNAGDTLFLQTETDVEADLADDGMRIATGNIVLDLNGDAANTLTPTAAQTEGPYYPVIDFSGYDNNLLSTADDDTLVTPVLAMATEFTLLNLNTASGDDFMTIPDVGNRMVREFEEYRPYISIVQFRREIGKYVDDAQVAAYEEYVYVPINVNDSDAETLKQLPGVDDTIAAELMAARPYASNADFLAKLAEYVAQADAASAVNYLEAE